MMRKRRPGKSTIPTPAKVKRELSKFESTKGRIALIKKALALGVSPKTRQLLRAELGTKVDKNGYDFLVEYSGLTITELKKVGLDAYFAKSIGINDPVYLMGCGFTREDLKLAGYDLPKFGKLFSFFDSPNQARYFIRQKNAVRILIQNGIKPETIIHFLTEIGVDKKRIADYFEGSGYYGWATRIRKRKKQK